MGGPMDCSNSIKNFQSCMCYEPHEEVQKISCLHKLIFLAEAPITKCYKDGITQIPEKQLQMCSVKVKVKKNSPLIRIVQKGSYLVAGKSGLEE